MWLVPLATMAVTPASFRMIPLRISTLATHLLEGAPFSFSLSLSGNNGLAGVYGSASRGSAAFSMGHALIIGRSASAVLMAGKAKTLVHQSFRDTWISTSAATVSLL